jgi:hypothetical protein
MKCIISNQYDGFVSSFNIPNKHYRVLGSIQCCHVSDFVPEAVGYKHETQSLDHPVQCLFL